MPVNEVAVLLKIRDRAKFSAEAKTAAADVRGIGTAAATAGGKADVAGVSAGTMGGRMRGAAKTGALALGAAIVAVGANSYKLSINFDKAMTLIQTQAGASTKEVGYFRKSVLDMTKSGEFAQGPKDMAKALFDIVSVGKARGLSPVTMMKDLRIASQGAAIGGADLEKTTSALASAWVVGIKGGGDFTNVLKISNATIGAGKMHMQDLTDALGQGLLPAAKNVGLTLPSVYGALATLTHDGYQASSAAAQLGTAFHFLSNPGKKATDALSSIHMSSSKLATDMRGPKGLLGALQDLNKHLPKAGVKREQILGDIIPGGRGKVLLSLLNQTKTYGETQKTITKTAGSTWAGLGKTEETALNKIARASSALQSNQISLGDVLKGPLTSAITWTMNEAGKFAGMLAVKLPSAVRTVSKFIHQMGPVFRLIGKIARPAIHGAILIFQGLGRAVGGVVAIITGLLTGNLGRAWRGVKAIFSGGLKFIIGAVTGALGPFAAAFHALWGAIGGTVHSIFNGVVNFFINRINNVIDVINLAIQAYNAIPLVSNISLVHHLGKAGGKAPAKLPKQFKGGPQKQTPGLNPRLHAYGGLIRDWGIVGDAGPELITMGARGAEVTPLTNASAGGMSGAGFGGMPVFRVEVPVFLHGKEIARATGEAVATRRARR